MTIFSDNRLSQRVERTEACSNADFVESHANLFPESGAEWFSHCLYSNKMAIETVTT